MRGCCALCVAAHNLQADIYLAGVYVRLLRRTTEDITHTWLLPEMVERIASMLTYFMDALVGRRLSHVRPDSYHEHVRWVLHYPSTGHFCPSIY